MIIDTKVLASVTNSKTQRSMCRLLRNSLHLLGLWRGAHRFSEAETILGRIARLGDVEAAGWGEASASHRAHSFGRGARPSRRGTGRDLRHRDRGKDA